MYSSTFVESASARSGRSRWVVTPTVADTSSSGSCSRGSRPANVTLRSPIGDEDELAELMEASVLPRVPAEACRWPGARRPR